MDGSCSDAEKIYISGEWRDAELMRQVRQVVDPDGQFSEVRQRIFAAMSFRNRPMSAKEIGGEVGWEDTPKTRAKITLLLHQARKAGVVARISRGMYQWVGPATRAPEGQTSATLSRGKAVQWLRGQLLRPGRHYVEDLRWDADMAGVTWRTIQRAKQELPVEVLTDRVYKRAYWKLAGQDETFYTET